MVMRIDLAGWALLLIAMAVGYLICLRASKEGSKLFKNSGYAIGIIILAASLILAICNMWSSSKRRQAVAPRRTDRTMTRPATRTKRPERPIFPRKAVGVTEKSKTAK